MGKFLLQLIVLMLPTMAVAEPECVLERLGSSGQTLIKLSATKVNSQPLFTSHYRFVQRDSRFGLLVEIMQRADDQTMSFSHVFAGIGWPHPTSSVGGWYGNGFIVGMVTDFGSQNLYCRDLELPYCKNRNTKHLCQTGPFQ